MAIEFTRKVYCDCCGKEVTDLFGGYDTLSLTSSHRLYDLCTECSELLEYKREIWEREMVMKLFHNEAGREDPEHE